MAEITESLQKYEEMFADRFSSEDQEYQKYLSRPPDPPPIVEGWRSRGGGNRGRDNRFHDRRGGHGWGRGRGWGEDRGWGGDRGWRGDHRRQHHWNDRDRSQDHDGERDRDRSRDRDRQWGHGSGYQSGPPGSNQGHNSHHQRPYYDRY